MYQPRTPNYRKSDPVMRWNLPDRVFFACGACHILAHAFIERFDAIGNLTPIWFHPKNGLPGNHIVVSGGDWVFDYHGYSNRQKFIDHCFRRARQRWPGWDADIQELPRHTLISEPDSRKIEGLWLRAAGQFLHNALPRAERYLDRFPPPPTTNQTLFTLP
ncbi:hypothetical protein ACQ0MK_19220 [Thalassospira lucentensis]|uniref:hypothetical protein n=1 Tax=Thalassospira lucentensis TaxID=168935 RepID=UPI003D2ED9D5